MPLPVASYRIIFSLISFGPLYGVSANDLHPCRVGGQRYPTLLAQRHRKASARPNVRQHTTYLPCSRYCASIYPALDGSLNSSYTLESERGGKNLTRFPSLREYFQIVSLIQALTNFSTNCLDAVSGSKRRNLNFGDLTDPRTRKFASGRTLTVDKLRDITSRGEWRGWTGEEIARGR